MIHPSYTELMAVINSEVEEGEQDRPADQVRFKAFFHCVSLLL